MGTAAFDKLWGAPDAAPSPTASFDALWGPSSIPVKPLPAAPSDATRQTPEVNPQAHQLTGLPKFGSDVFSAAAGMLENPTQTLYTGITAPLSAAKTAAQFMGQSAAETSLPADVRARALADPERIDEPTAALAGLQLAVPELGGTFTGPVGRGLVGGATGAVYSPEHPAVGAALGTAAGLVASRAADDPYTLGMRVQRTTPAPEPEPEPIPAERQLANPNKVETTATATTTPAFDELWNAKAQARTPAVAEPIDETLAKHAAENATPASPQPEQSAAARPSPAPEIPEHSVPTDTPLAGGGTEPSGGAMSETPELDRVLAEMRDTAEPQTAPFKDGQGYDVPVSDEDEPHADGALPPVEIPQGPHPAPAAPGLGSIGGSLPSVADLKRHIVAVVNPRALGADAFDTGGTIRATTSQGQRQSAIAEQSLSALSKFAGSLSRTENTNLINLQERTPKGQAVRTGNANLDVMVNAFKQITEDYEKKLTAINKLTPTMMSYLGRYVVQGQEPVNVLANSLASKRPAFGPQSFAKQRTYPHFTDMLDAGLTPKTYNFVKAQLMKFQEMQRVLDMDAALKQEHAAGRHRNVMVGREPPVDANGDEWQRIDPTGRDPAFTVYGPRSVEISAGLDARQDAVIDQATRAIPGLNTNRPIKVRSVQGEPALGFAVGPHGNYMESQFGTGSLVKMHELGHILDFKYGLGDYLHRGETSAMSAKLRKQMHELAKQRFPGIPESSLTEKQRAYFFDPREQTANALHAYLHAPELMKQYAPDVQKRLASWLDRMAQGGHKFAKILKAAKPSLQIGMEHADLPIPGVRIMGHAYAPKNSAQVWNNYLSKGLGANPLYQLWRAPSSAATQTMLSLSGFHLSTTSFIAAFDEMARQLRTVTNKGSTPTQRLTALASAVPRAVIAPIQSLRLGHRILQQYKIPGMHPELEKTMQQMIQGGFKVAPKHEEHLQLMLNGIRNAMEANGALPRAKGIGQAAWNAPWALIEQAARPVMGGWVPRLKAAMIYNSTADAMKKKGPLTTAQLRKVAGAAVDDADWWLGQVMRDNHFVHRMADNIASGLLLAPGWTAGTIVTGVNAVKETAGSVNDAARGRRPQLGTNASRWLAMAVGTAIWGALMQKWLTGTNPESVKDLYFPWDGTYDRDGNKNRINPPTYGTHDVYGYFSHFLRTVIGKLNPLLGAAGEIARNKNYFDNQIYNPHDSPLKQTVQVGKRVAETFEPLVVKNFLEGKRRNERAGPMGVASAFGFTPASKEVIRSPAQNLMNELLVAHGHAQLTPEAAQDQQAKADALEQLRSGTSDAFNKMIAEGKLSRKQIQSAMTSIGKLSLKARFDQLSLPEAEQVNALASPVEKQMWALQLTLKRMHEAQSGRTSNLQPVAP